MIATKEAYQLLHDGQIALAQVESNGVLVDLEYLDRTIEESEKKIKANEEEIRKDRIYQLWRREFGSKTSLGNKEQLGRIVFKVLGHQRKKDKENNDEAAFEHIEEPFVKKYFRNEKIKKALSTYLLGIRKHQIYGRVHPSYNLNIPQTFRSSCDGPNWQNIPIRDPEMAAIIRRCYIAPPGFHFTEVDLSGAEVRVAACYTKDPVLIDYVKHSPPKDMHRDMAMEIFMLEEAQVKKKETRDSSKNMFVFPTFYGSTWYNCSKDIWEAMHLRKFTIVGDDGAELMVVDHLKKKGIKSLGSAERNEDPQPGTFQHHLRTVERDFWQRRFKVYAQWKDDWFREYKKHGQFKTYTGFVCRGIYNKKDVSNYPIQGSAFHCLLLCLIKIQNWLNRNKMKTRIVGQVHDSIAAEVHESELEKYLTYCKYVFTEWLPKQWDWIIVPIEVEADVSPVGKSWYEKKEYKL